MKTLKGVIFTVFVLLSSKLHSQWIPYYLPYQGIAYSIDFYGADKGVSGGHTLPISVNEYLYFTSDGGNNWLLASYPSNVRALPTVQFVNSSIVYAAGAENMAFCTYQKLSEELLKLPFHLRFNLQLKGIGYSLVEYKGVFLKSSNSGVNWEKVGELDTTTGYFEDIHFFNENQGYAIIDSGSIGNSRFLKTSNGGLNWEVIRIEPFLRLGRIEFINANTGFVCGDVSDSSMFTALYAVIFKTTNAGLSWNKTDFPFTSSIVDVSFINANTGFALGNGDFQTSCTKIYRTTNAGLNWDSIASVFSVIPTRMKSIQGSGTVYATGYYYDWVSGIGKITTMKTTNYGLNWQITFIPVDTYIAGLSLIDQNTFYMSGGVGLQQAVIYKSTNGGVSVNELSMNMPSDLNLYQNYPNPFNSSTQITFELKKREKLQLRVFDINGKQIAMLLNSTVQPGFHKIKFDASLLSSGIYFYQLSGNNFRITRKMLLIK